MKKILIAIPTMATVPIEFMLSMLGLQTVEQTEVSVVANSLVYTARNQLALKAIEEKFDYILWLDSDMVFPSDTLKKLYEKAEKNNLDFISGLYFSRTQPQKPVVYKSIDWEQDPKTALIKHSAEPWYDYPKDQIFGIGGSGFGCVLVKTSLIKLIAERFQVSPFEPMPFLGEDLAFCWRVSKLGKRMYCDSRVKLGHVGSFVFDEESYDAQTRQSV